MPWYRPLGATAYGVDPFRLERSEQQRGLHGNDERVKVASLGSGARFVYDILRAPQRHTARLGTWTPASRTPNESLQLTKSRGGSSSCVTRIMPSLAIARDRAGVRDSADPGAAPMVPGSALASHDST
jgi:hypothetical protein